MSAPVFVDTNVFAYSRDTGVQAKTASGRSLARVPLGQLPGTQEHSGSFQVLRDDDAIRRHRLTGDSGSSRKAAVSAISCGVSQPLAPKRGMCEQGKKACAFQIFS